MKFYEFKNFGYYALIGASTIQGALEEYKNIIADFDEKLLRPNEITFKEASNKYCKCLLEEGAENKTYEKFKEDFNKFSQNEEVCIFLIDGSLL